MTTAAPAEAEPRADGEFDWHAAPGPDKFAEFMALDSAL
jgi:hypothetical protein